MYSVFLHLHQCPSYCLPEEGPRLKCSVRVAQRNNEALAWNLRICEGYLFTTLTYPHHSPWPEILAVRGFMLQILTCIQCNTSMFNSLVHRPCHYPIFDQYRYISSAHHISNTHSSTHVRKLLHRNVKGTHLCQGMYIYLFRNM